MTLSVSEKAFGQILRVIERLQKRFPRQPVTQKRVQDLIKRAFNEPDLSDRHVRRAFRKLREDSKIVRDGRGQYWLPEYLNKNIKYLKKQFELERDFWGTENKIMAMRISELEQKLQWQEIYYEDILEQKEREQILREEKFTKEDLEQIKRARKQSEG